MPGGRVREAHKTSRPGSTTSTTTSPIVVSASDPGRPGLNRGAGGSFRASSPPSVRGGERGGRARQPARPLAVGKSRSKDRSNRRQVGWFNPDSEFSGRVIALPQSTGALIATRYGRRSKASTVPESKTSPTSLWKGTQLRRTPLPNCSFFRRLGPIFESRPNPERAVRIDPHPGLTARPTA